MELTVQKREKLGKAAKALKKEGLIPAELYGKGIQNIHLKVGSKEFKKIFKEAGESTLINIVLASPTGEEKRPVMIHSVSSNPLTDEITSIDFYQIKMDEKITVSVPLQFVGVSPAVKNKGGILIKAMQELEVEALPTSIPHLINLDLSLLGELNQSLYVKDLKIPENVKVLVDAETVIATVKEPEKEEEISEAEISVDSVKVEGEEKVSERQSKKEESLSNKQIKEESDKK